MSVNSTGTEHTLDTSQDEEITLPQDVNLDEYMTNLSPNDSGPDFQGSQDSDGLTETLTSATDFTGLQHQLSQELSEFSHISDDDPVNHMPKEESFGKTIAAETAERSNVLHHELQLSTREIYSTASHLEKYSHTVTQDSPTTEDTAITFNQPSLLFELQNSSEAAIVSEENFPIYIGQDCSQFDSVVIEPTFVCEPPIVGEPEESLDQQAHHTHSVFLSNEMVGTCSPHQSHQTMLCDLNAQTAASQTSNALNRYDELLTTNGCKTVNDFSTGFIPMQSTLPVITISSTATPDSSITKINKDELIDQFYHERSPDVFFGDGVTNIDIAANVTLGTHYLNTGISTQRSFHTQNSKHSSCYVSPSSTSSQRSLTGISDTSHLTPMTPGPVSSISSDTSEAICSAGSMDLPVSDMISSADSGFTSNITDWDDDSSVPNTSSLEIPLTVEDMASSPQCDDLSTKSKRKRKKDKSSTKGGEPSRKLWEFLLDTLCSTVHNPSVMKWLDKANGVFNISDHTKLAELWTETKQRQSGVKYEFLARALRHYYTQDILKRIPGRKLVYQFGDKCPWRQYLRTKENIATATAIS